jgi:hypothetical protein
MRTDGWIVTRNCCTSGLCAECHANGGKQRVIHAQGVSEATAKLMEKNWSAYAAKASPMPATAVSRG